MKVSWREAWNWYRLKRSERMIWVAATTVQELGERGAAWCREDLYAHPMGYDVPEAETQSILPMLERANAAGFFTIQSQPGGCWVEDGVLWEQRAFVQGYLDRDRLEEFRRHLEGAGMLVLDSFGADIVVTRENGEMATSFSGGWDRPDNYLNGLSRQAFRAIADAASLTVVDMKWHRDSMLWEALDCWSVARP